MDSNPFRSLDTDRININEYFEVEYWANQFDLNPEVFKKLIKDTGITSAEVLKAFLHKNFGEKAA